MRNGLRVCRAPNFGGHAEIKAGLFPQMTLTPKRRWFSFSLRTLFVVVTVFCLWLGWNVQIVHERNAMRDKIRRNGGWVVIESSAKGFITSQGPVEYNGGQITYPASLEIRETSPDFQPLNPISIVRRMLGDENVVMVQVKRESEVESVQRVFPGCIVVVDRLLSVPNPFNSPTSTRP